MSAMHENSRHIRLVEVPSELAGAKLGAGGGIEALKCYCDETNCGYFERYPIVRIQDENHASLRGTPYGHARYIDHVSVVLERVASKVEKLRNDNFFPIIMAGDHSTAAGTLAGLQRAHKGETIGIVWIDAHADMHTPYTSPSGNMHGMPLSVAMGEDNRPCQINTPSDEENHFWEKLKHMGGGEHIDPKNVVFCALRDFEEAEAKMIERYGIKNYTTEMITYEGVRHTVENIMKDLEHCDHIYISFDVDSIDPLYIPGTGTPVDWGLSFEQALHLNMELIQNKKVCCWEMAEINPFLDKQNISGKYSFQILDQVTQRLLDHY